MYRPAQGAQKHHEIIFAHGFFSSALHECAHWFIAGPERRQQEDYGYWYAPDGRTPEQQNIFEQVEIKPQAIEWVLSAAVGYPFKLSFDNLTGEPFALSTFKQAVYQQALCYEEIGLPPRAEYFKSKLIEFYPTRLMIDLDRL